MKKQKSYIWILSILSVIGFVGIWWFCCDVLKLTSSSTLPGPVTVIKTFIAKLSSSAPDGATLPQHIGSSLKIALGGWALGVVIGTPLGICMAWYKKVDLFARPIFDLLRPVPGLAWIPLMIILFGIGITPKIVTVFLSAFVPCVLNSYTGIRQTKDVHLWVGQTFGASDTQMLLNLSLIHIQMCIRDRVNGGSLMRDKFNEISMHMEEKMGHPFFCCDAVLDLSLIHIYVFLSINS